MSKRWLLSLMLMLSAPVANADGYFGAGIGRTSVDVEPLSRLVEDSFSVTCGVSVTCADTIDDSDTVLKIFGGARFTPNLAVEGFYVDLGSVSAAAVVTSGPTGVAITQSTEASAFGLALVGIAPLGPSAELFGKIGIARWSADADIHANVFGTPAMESADDDGVDPMFGIGLQWNAGDKFSLRFEFERFTDIGGEDTTGQSDVDLISLSLVVPL